MFWNVVAQKWWKWWRFGRTGNVAPSLPVHVLEEIQPFQEELQAKKLFVTFYLYCTKLDSTLELHYMKQGHIWTKPRLSILFNLRPVSATVLAFEWFPLLCFNHSSHRERSCSFLSLIFPFIFFLPPVHGFSSWRLWYLVNSLTALLTQRSDSLQPFQIHCFFICMHHSHLFLCRLDQSQY